VLRREFARTVKFPIRWSALIHLLTDLAGKPGTGPHVPTSFGPGGSETKFAADRDRDHRQLACADTRLAKIRLAKICCKNLAKIGCKKGTAGNALRFSRMSCVRSGKFGVALVALIGQASAQLATSVGNESPSVDPRRGVIAPTAQLELTTEQKAAIFDAVRPADGKVKAPGNVPVAVGAQVPPVTELYFLPDNGLATAPEAKGVKYTVAQNRVVLVDPTTMRVVDVIP
jgi:hypothetical protein